MESALVGLIVLLVIAVVYVLFKTKIKRIQDELNRTEGREFNAEYYFWVDTGPGINQRIERLEADNKRLHALLAECIDYVYRED